MNARGPETARIDIIQAFRGIASLGVVFWHASNFLGPYHTGIGGFLFFPAGMMGVSLFFVISGFIMVYSNTKNDGSFRYFYSYAAKRIARIWPIYALGSVAAFLIILDRNQTLSRLLLSLAFVPNQDWPSLAVGWTLNYEMHFYVIFGVSLLFGRLQWIALAAYFLTTLVLIPGIAGSFSLDATGVPDHATSLSFIVHNPINWLFFCGVIIGLIFLSDFRIRNAALARVLLVASIALAAVQYGMHFRLGYGITQSGLSLVPMVLVGTLASKSAKISIPKWMSDLGRMSYSLYLFHPFVLHFYQRMIADQWTDPTGGYINFVAVSALSVVAASVINRFVEERLDRYFRSRLLGGERAGQASIFGSRNRLVNSSSQQ
ncbi:MULTISPECIES: acyltransferase [unclassified Mesorhizobium]|uniref:acyltransferase family protein n=1 Tax=unclassified Mesorhizobium TaxID=325217 RepID=UPI001129D255|nr:MULTISPECIES: acyltransferase [unclassified Mesorhizobium]MCA0025462.1 acyltransferase [Mesorhizobium sp. B263B1A]TPJ97149.1 acyltransferase [Mesorhizobium sp. B2-5-12]TPK27184.1 acyltransferase [Mesorhizobium sp. B2-5-6]